MVAALLYTLWRLGCRAVAVVVEVEEEEGEGVVWQWHCLTRAAHVSIAADMLG